MISSYKRKNIDRDVHVSPESKKEKLTCSQGDDDNEKIRKIIKTEFSNEVSRKENEISIIEERLKIVQKTLHLLRYVCVVSFYNRKPGVLVDQNVERREKADLSNDQFRLHPAVKKIIGGNNVQFEPLRTRRKIAQRKEDGNENSNTSNPEPPTEKSNDTLLQLNGNCDSANEKSSILISSPVQNVSSSFTAKNKESFLSSSSRNERYKNKHCIIVGNISKWNPPDNKVDKSTYKWMVYVRGPKENPDISSFVKKIRFFLHPSYQPNDVVEIIHPPFHLVRRGWGEFPLRVQVHFHNRMNKPLDIIHTLKLDQSRSGLQTLGAETVVDVWIYTEVPSLSENVSAGSQTKLILETLDFENNEEESIDNHSDSNIPDELLDNYRESTDNLATVENFKETSTSRKNEKPNNNLILENNSDRNNLNKSNLYDSATKVNKANLCDNATKVNKANLKENNILCSDLTKTETLIHCKSSDNTSDNKKSNRLISSNNVQHKLINCINQIVILKKNNVRSLLRPRNQISLLKNNINKNSSNNHVLSKVPVIARSIDDIHNYCQILEGSDSNINEIDSESRKFDCKRYKIEFPNHRFGRVTCALNYLLRRLPVITDLASDPSYLKLYPYTASTLEQYLSWNNAKKFYSEWYRAKVIKGILSSTDFPGCENWSIKSIIKYAQLHGYSYYNTNNTNQQSCKTVPQKTSLEHNVINSFTFSPELLEIIEYPKCSSYISKMDSYDEDEIDILSNEPENKKLNESDDSKKIKHIIQDKFSALPRRYIKETCEKLNVKLIPEEITPGVWYSASETVILTAVKCLAEDIIRKSLNCCTVKRGIPNEINIQDVQEALTRRPEFDLFLNYGLGKQ